MGHERLYLGGSKELIVFNIKTFPDDFSTEI